MRRQLIRALASSNITSQKSQAHNLIVKQKHTDNTCYYRRFRFQFCGCLLSLPFCLQDTLFLTRSLCQQLPEKKESSLYIDMNSVYYVNCINSQNLGNHSFQINESYLHNLKFVTEHLLSNQQFSDLNISFKCPYHQTFYFPI